MLVKSKKLLESVVFSELVSAGKTYIDYLTSTRNLPLVAPQIECIVSLGEQVCLWRVLGARV
jgi:hypothetical protein